MTQLGRIGGQVLTDNLLRAGVDLAFDTNLLYLKVNPVTAGSQSAPNFEDGDPNFGKPLSTSSPTSGIGIRRDVPVYDLDVNSQIITNDLEVTNQAAIANVRITAPNTFSTSVGGIAVRIAGSTIFHDRLITQVSGNARLIFDGNAISTAPNQNIIFDPNGSGTVEFQASTNVTGNVGVSGNINVSGNLSGISSITLGDQTIDTVTIVPDFTQSIIPGDDLIYALGADAADSSSRRWAQIHAPDWTNITTGVWPGSGLRPQSTTISDQMQLNGVINKIQGIQSNEDIVINPDTGITYVERTKWQDGVLTNLLNTPLTFANTGIGYIRLNGTNGFVVPSGDNSQRRPSPEVGETRWNTEEQYLECYDGSVWIVSTGGGEIVTQEYMSDLGFIYSAILG